VRHYQFDLQDKFTRGDVSVTVNRKLVCFLH